jgi:preflagellin peptidase FlaK
MTGLFFDINALRILFALIMLAIASALDLWKREIHDILWIIFGAITVMLIVFSPDPLGILKTTGISLIIAPLAIVLWRIGIFGGADALGLIVLSGLAPMMSFTDNTITPFTTLTNAAILSLAPMFLNIIRNLMAMSNHKNIFEGFDETKLKKILAMFFGYRAKSPKYSFSIEKIEGNSKKLDFSLKHAENEQFCNTANTWITPGIPYIIYIAVGFAVQLLFGDIIFNFIVNIKGT